MSLAAERTFSQTAADLVTRFQGTWRYLGLLTLPIGAWIILAHDLDPGYWLLNLAVSLLGTYMPSIVLMSQNRQNEREHQRDRHAERETREQLREINRKLEQLLNR